jgi:hypothetical protein
MTARRVLLVALVLLVAVATAGCRKVVSEELLENAIGGVMFSIAGTEVDIDCPANKTMATNNDFFCRTEISGRRGWILVLQHDDYGRMEFRRETPIRVKEEVEPLLERYMLRQFDQQVEADCPDDVIQEPGEDFRCDIEPGSHMNVRQVDGVNEYAFNRPIEELAP